MESFLMEYDLENPLANFYDRNDNDVSLFLIESDHIPSESYLLNLRARDFDVSVRREIISLITQFSFCKFDPLLSYLAINYLDRVLSSQQKLQPKPWVRRLIAISCTSLAAKMKKAEFSLNDIQGDTGIIFDAQTIMKMEFLVLGALEWRMRSVTPFSFISFFISLFNLKDVPRTQVLKARVTEIIFKSQRDVEMLQFKPSVIAASALLSASHELFPLRFPGFIKIISNCPYVNKDHVLQCCNVMQDLVIDGKESVIDIVSSSETPVNVLDSNFFGSGSEGPNGSTMVSITLRQEKDIKKRNISDHCPDCSDSTLVMRGRHL